MPFFDVNIFERTGVNKVWLVDDVLPKFRELFKADELLVNASDFLSTGFIVMVRLVLGLTSPGAM